MLKHRKNQAVPVLTKILLLGAVALGLQACSQKIDARQTQSAQGLIYKMNSDDPFTGTVENYEMYRLGLSYNHYPCTIKLKKGLLDGTATCLTPAGKKVASVEYAEGKQNGLTQIWDEDSGELIAKTEVHNGMKNGVAERFNPKTGKVVRQTHWVDDKKEGEEKVWDSTGETLLTDLVWKNGLQTGFERFSESERNFKNGQPDGIQRHYMWKGEYSKFSLAEGIAQAIGAGYFVPLISNDSNDYTFTEENYVDGKRQQTSSSNGPTIQPAASDFCVDGKIDLFHKNNGEDAVISNDQLEEWKKICSK